MKQNFSNHFYRGKNEIIISFTEPFLPIFTKYTCNYARCDVLLPLGSFCLYLLLDNCTQAIVPITTKCITNHVTYTWKG